MTTLHTHTEEHLPMIKVFSPCACGAKRWFQCRCDSFLLAEYECSRGLDGTGRVHPDDSAHVASLHPGMDLIYIA